MADARSDEVEATLSPLVVESYSDTVIFFSKKYTTMVQQFFALCRKKIKNIRPGIYSITTYAEIQYTTTDLAPFLS
jgi:hypothetical protein